MLNDLSTAGRCGLSESTRPLCVRSTINRIIFLHPSGRRLSMTQDIESPDLLQCRNAVTGRWLLNMPVIAIWTNHLSPQRVRLHAISHLPLLLKFRRVELINDGSGWRWTKVCPLFGAPNLIPNLGRFQSLLWRRRYPFSLQTEHIWYRAGRSIAALQSRKPWGSGNGFYCGKVILYL